MVHVRFCLAFVAAILSAAVTSVGADKPDAIACPAGKSPCSTFSSTIPGTFPSTLSQPSPKDLKHARQAFTRGIKLHTSGHKQDAFRSFEQAARLAPKNSEYVAAREVTRQQLVYDHLQRGNAELLAGRQVEAIAAFRTALNLDPTNEFALQRMRDSLGEWLPAKTQPARVLASAGEIQVTPLPVHADFHLRIDARDLLQRVASTYGLTITVDDSVVARRVYFDIDNVDFATAMGAASKVTKTFWSALSEKEILAANDTPENHRQFDRMGLRTFYVPDATTPQQLMDVVNVLRVLFEVRFVSQNNRASTITVRAPQPLLDAATKLLEGLDSSRPQVLLDVHLYQISRTLTRSIGINAPADFHMFNIPAGALAALGNQNVQDLINQLISSGGINQANTQAISALLAQLQNQANSLFANPLATFGNGTTLFGVAIPQVTAALSLNESSVSTLQHVTLHAAQGDAATFRAGTRFPILNASFSPISNSPALSKVIGNNSFISPFPSFNYEDLGLTLKAKPAIHGTSSVTLNLELQLRALGGQSFNGVPVIVDREYKGTITVQDGQPAIVAGTMSNSETHSMTGIPGLGQFPALSTVTSSKNKQHDEDELLIMITPHVVSSTNTESTEVWLPAGR